MEIARTFSIDLVFVGKTTEKQQATGNKDYLSLLTIFNTNVKVIILFKVLFVPNKICRWQILKGLLLYSSCNVHSLFHSELLISLVWKPNQVSSWLDATSQRLKLVGFIVSMPQACRMHSQVRDSMSSSMCWYWVSLQTRSISPD